MILIKKGGIKGEGGDVKPEVVMIPQKVRDNMK